MFQIGCIRGSFIGTTLACLISLSALPSGTFGEELFRINLVDQSNGWPVPLVELSTTHQVHFVSDNAGVIAFDLPELMNTPTWLTVNGRGYNVAKDGFGLAGIRVTPKPGEETTIRLRRALPAKRLGRITGGGIFAESQRFGLYESWPEQGLLGCDSVQLAVHRGKLYWAWGDTTLAKYPLGLFHMTGGVTATQPLQQFQPPIQLQYDYFRDAADEVRSVARMPGDGPTWLSGFVSLEDAEGQERLVASYNKIDPPLATYECGLCVWNDDVAQFVKLTSIWQRSAPAETPSAMPHGHPVRWTDKQGDDWILFGDPFPTLRCRATFEAWGDPDQWEAIEPPQSVATRGGQRIEPHRGSIAWNEFRGKWIAIFTQLHGDESPLGEIWYAESDTPFGEWENGFKVASHSGYTFYNPCMHPEFVPAESPMVLFEGTYTKTFSAAKRATSRHDYNQILYRLDLDELFAGMQSGSDNADALDRTRALCSDVAHAVAPPVLAESQAQYARRARMVWDASRSNPEASLARAFAALEVLGLVADE